MKDAHADLKITRADFNALVEVLQQAMREAGIPSATQNRLLALLAPMHREIVTDFTDGEDLLIMKESDILGIVEKTPAAKK